MSQYQVHNLFPTPLFVHDGIETTEEQRDFVYNTEWYRPEADNGWLSSNHYLLDEDVMKTFKTKIMDCIKLFAHNEIALPEQMTLRMTNSWAVKHTQGDWAQMHVHTNSVFSGVYYMDTNNDTGNISFQRNTDNHVLPMTSRPGEYTKRNDLNSDVYNVEAINDRVVLFPSNLLHGVRPNKSEWDRYSIAFNFFPVGHWGRDEHELML